MSNKGQTLEEPFFLVGDCRWDSKIKQYYLPGPRKYRLPRDKERELLFAVTDTYDEEMSDLTIRLIEGAIDAVEWTEEMAAQLCALRIDQWKFANGGADPMYYDQVKVPEAVMQDEIKPYVGGLGERLVQIAIKVASGGYGSDLRNSSFIQDAADLVTCP